MAPPHTNKPILWACVWSSKLLAETPRSTLLLGTTGMGSIKQGAAGPLVLVTRQALQCRCLSQMPEPARSQAQFCFGKHFKFY